MTITYAKFFEPNQVDNAAPETLYTVPALPGSNLLRNGRIRFSNTTAGAVTITAWAVPAAGSAADANKFFPAYAIPAYGFIDVDVPNLKAGDFVQGQAGAAASISACLMDGFLQS